MFSLALLAGMAGVAARAALIDHRIGRLPNLLTGIVAGLATCLVAAWVRIDSRPAVSAAVAWLAVCGLHLVLVITPPYGMGAGDLKLVAGLMAPLAWWGNWWIWLLSAYAGAVVGMAARTTGPLTRTYVRMGPWLVTAWLATVMGQLTHVALAYRW